MPVERFVDSGPDVAEGLWEVSGLPDVDVELEAVLTAVAGGSAADGRVRARRDLGGPLDRPRLDCDDAQLIFVEIEPAPGEVWARDLLPGEISAEQEHGRAHESCY